ncbi:hypothetical protein Y032_0122g1040 [Ancylostoma ceylanicum]|uniref:39S ribosomal protein L55, mitochondrial n=1 Tax=Ancylostoma ceylanicum TaxID=53326 RepID=A0A016T9R4_9BILA|nr:hypothetical protein Y032_0122g1040 [Ancylostoma ceylanicum]
MPHTSNQFNLLIADRENAWRACLGKICRNQYLRHYPVRLIRPDGSSIEIRYLEPRSVVQLPVDVNALSEDEKRQRLAARKPKAKKIVQVWCYVPGLDHKVTEHGHGSAVGNIFEVT